jgi:RsiW-degrading membrane proteinase PrsW (M82 family)
MKLRLTINSGSLAGQSFELETGFLTIGRSEMCSIRFDPLRERIASKQHAFIEARPDGFYITDNNSTNGTLVNGERIQAAKLADGDSVRFGRNGSDASVNIQADEFGSEMTADRFNSLEASQFQQASQARPVTIQGSISQLGLGNMATAAPKPVPVGRYIGIGITIFAIIVMSAIVGLIMYLSLDIGPAIVATVVAFTPALFYLVPFIWLDRYDPEPLWLLALAFAWGALVAVLVSIVINTVIGIVVTIGALVLGLPPQLGELAAAVVSAPVFE